VLWPWHGACFTRACHQAMLTSAHTEAPRPKLASVSARILLAEDDASFRSLLAMVLRERGYEVKEAADGQDLLEKVSAAVARSGRHGDIDIIVADIRLPRWTGMDVLRLMRNAHVGTPVLLITAFGDAEVHRAAYELGAWVLDKPFDLEDFVDAVAALLRQSTRAASRFPCGG
jgi:DNA-binding response OmpR family regulator